MSNTPNDDTTQDGQPAPAPAETPDTPNPDTGIQSGQPAPAESGGDAAGDAASIPANQPAPQGGQSQAGGATVSAPGSGLGSGTPVRSAASAAPVADAAAATPRTMTAGGVNLGNRSPDDSKWRTSGEAEPEQADAKFVAPGRQRQMRPLSAAEQGQPAINADILAANEGAEATRVARSGLQHEAYGDLPASERPDGPQPTQRMLQGSNRDLNRQRVVDGAKELKERLDGGSWTEREGGPNRDPDLKSEANSDAD